MKKIRKEQIELPLEIGKTYKTKFATGENFIVTELTKDKSGKVVKVWGLYEKHLHLGVCPIGVDRLIPETQVTGVEYEVIQCPNCNHEFKC